MPIALVILMTFLALQSRQQGRAQLPVDYVPPNEPLLLSALIGG